MANVLAGGHSGRPHTFIVGLDDSRFPGARLQDPILLDDERRGLSRELRTSASDLAKRIELVARLLARLRGTVTLSYSCFNLTDDREMFPSSIVLSAFRILSGQRDGDQAALNHWLGPAASFAPSAAEKALTESEWWLWRMSGKAEVIDPSSLVAARYPHLGRGFELAQERESTSSPSLTAGFQQPRPELDLTSPAGPTVSASRLETLGQCPLRYFFRYVLEIEPPEELDDRPGVWLDPLARGSLLHEVFELFLNELIKRRRIPDVAARRSSSHGDPGRSHRPIIETRFHPPREAVFRREQARAQAHGADLPARRGGVLPRNGQPTAVPGSVDRNEGRRDRTRARHRGTGRGETSRRQLVAGSRPDRPHRPGCRAEAERLRDLGLQDRRDLEIHPGTTPLLGRTSRSARALPVRHERSARGHGQRIPGAQVERFGYFFPSEKASGERIEFTPEQLEEGKNVLARLARIASSGAFLATTTADKDCGFCDYQGICGDVAAVAAASDRKLQAPANAILTPYAELRTNG